MNFSESTRVKLLRQSLREVALAEDVHLDQLAVKLDGYSGSDICNLCRSLLNYIFTVLFYE